MISIREIKYTGGSQSYRATEPKKMTMVLPIEINHVDGVIIICIVTIPDENRKKTRTLANFFGCEIAKTLSSKGRLLSRYSSSLNLYHMRLT